MVTYRCFLRWSWHALVHLSARPKCVYLPPILASVLFYRFFRCSLCGMAQCFSLLFFSCPTLLVFLKEIWWFKILCSGCRCQLDFYFPTLSRVGSHMSVWMETPESLSALACFFFFFWRTCHSNLEHASPHNASHFLFFPDFLSLCQKSLCLPTHAQDQCCHWTTRTAGHCQTSAIQSYFPFVVPLYTSLLGAIY